MFSHKKIQKIDPAKLTAKSRPLLKALLNEYGEMAVLDALDAGNQKSKIYLVPDAKKPGKSHSVMLTNSLIAYSSTSKKTKCTGKKHYAICDATHFGQGANSKVYLSQSTIKVSSDTGDFEISQRKPGKDRAVWRLIPTSETTKPQVQNNIVGKMEKFLKQESLFSAKDAVLATNKNNAALIMRRFPGKPLGDYIRQDYDKNGAFFSVDQRITLTMMIGAAIDKHMHQNNIIHRDITENNIIVELDNKNNPKNVYIIDVSSAKWKDEHQVDENVGTPGYQAPEQLQHHAFSDEKSDAFSFTTTISKGLWQCVMDMARYDGLELEDRLAIDYTLNKGRDRNSAERASIVDIVKEFQKIKTKRNTSSNQSSPRSN